MLPALRCSALQRYSSTLGPVALPRSLHDFEDGQGGVDLVQLGASWHVQVSEVQLVVQLHLAAVQGSGAVRGYVAVR